MGWLETLRTAIEALAGRRMRTLLTLLGILIGIAAVMLTVGLGEGARREINREIDKLGSNLLIVVPGSGSDSPSAATTLSVDDAAVIADSAVAPDVTGVAPIMSTRSLVRAGTADWTTTITGSTIEWPLVRSRELIDGRFFTADEEAGAQQVAILGPSTAAQLFADEPPVGNTITIGSQMFTVVGVLTAVGSSSITNDDDQVVIPMTTFAQRLSSTSDTRAVSAIYVAARNQDSISSAHQQITRALVANHQTTAADQDFTIITFEALMTAAETTTAVLTTLLSSIAGISLLVGGIGVMNIMLVSVSERVREIGLRKALGATPAVIRRQFLVEAGIVGLIGGTLGVFTGSIGSAILSPILEIDVAVSPGATVIALGVSLTVGLVAGVYPASRAARLAPIDALRSE
ncbi:MAG: ABC transporter permease [Brooklawnia sp.]|uniref:ABC transporter permease n=1 Tax=Brooklawnia sp. TaxID=2699740 RepID=UPI003C77385D